LKIYLFISILAVGAITPLNHDNLDGFVANEHIDHPSVSILSGTGLAGGGDISANRTLSLSHLGLESLSDPNADRIPFWDDAPSGTFAWKDFSNWDTHLTSNGTDHTYIDQDLQVTASPTWTGATLSGLTPGRVLFAGTGGLIDDDADLLWKNSTKILKVDGSLYWGSETQATRMYEDGFFNTYEVRNQGMKFLTTRDVDDIIFVVNSSEAMRIDATNGFVKLFSQATEGETQELQIYGFGTGSGGKESLDISVEQYAANTAHFRGLDIYELDGFVRAASTVYRRYYHLSVGGFDPGASGAAWTDPDGNTTGGWQLNAEGETLIAGTDIHADWDGASNIMVDISFALNAAGNPNDTVDIKAVAYYNGVGDTATKTQTVEVSTVTDGTQFKVYKAVLTIDYDAVDNVIDVGDKVVLVFNLETDTSEIDDIVITHGSFYYNTTHVGIESGDT